MLRKNFESEIQKLKNEILSFGAMVEQNLVESVDALKKRDVNRSHKVVEVDKSINKKRFELENEVELVDGYNRLNDYGFKFDFTLTADIAHCCYGRDPDGNLIEISSYK